MPKRVTTILSILVFLGSMAGWSGCATIVHVGGGQDVPVTSRPAGADISDGLARGKTPAMVTVRKTGDNEESQLLTHPMSSWVGGNLVLSGRAYNVEPEYGGLTLTQSAKEVTKYAPLTTQREEAGYFTREPQAWPHGQRGKLVTPEQEQRRFSDVLPPR
jgi:hypothetical protein